MRSFTLPSELRKRLWHMLALFVGIRAMLMIVFPLTDNTEARYGEIARKMLETGNWVTPLHDYGVPFWAKPPLSIWLSTASMKLLGVNGFAARLPNLLMSVAIVAMVFYLGQRRHNRDFGLFTATLLFGFPLFYVTSGTVMTDTSLAFSVSISFLAFWMAVKQSEGRGPKIWGHLFFLGQGLGLLAKGPICGVMTIFPILLWAIILRHQWRPMWNRLPWVKGILLTCLIAAPWYILAERRTPGFIDYFIVGEHVKRFLVPDWHGDLYGYAHEQPFGTIWLFWVVGVFPWSLYAVVWSLRHLKTLRKLLQDQDGWALYLVCWSIWPMAFFTMAGNIIWPYVITGLPAFALLVAELWHRRRGQLPIQGALRCRRWIWLSMALPAVMITAIVAIWSEGFTHVRESQVALVHKYLEVRESPASQLYYINTRRYSAEFYTQGKARHTNDLAVISKLTDNDTRDFIAIREKDLCHLPQELQRHFERVYGFDGMLLLEESE